MPSHRQSHYGKVFSVAVNAMVTSRVASNKYVRIIGNKFVTRIGRVYLNWATSHEKNNERPTRPKTTKKREETVCMVTAPMASLSPNIRAILRSATLSERFLL